MTETLGGYEQLERAILSGESLTLAVRRAILVLGMHRSGTSAFGGVINALGAAAPKTLMSANEWNPRGDFESAALFTAHDKLLESAGSDWHDWRQIDPQWFHSREADENRQKIKAILIEEFDNEPLILIKDPRICRFVPFFLSILEEMKIAPVAILPVRNPLEVAYSLMRREVFALPKSILLWLRHTLEDQFNSRHLPRCFLSYEELLIDWRSHADRATEKTGVHWPINSARSDVAVSDFLASDLRHQKVSLEELNVQAEVAPLARETYSILSEIVAGGECQPLLDRLDAVRNKFDEGCLNFAGASADHKTSAVNALGSITTSRNNPITEHDASALIYDKLTLEHAALACTHKSLITEHDALTAVNNSLSLEHEILACAHNNLIDEHEALAGVYSSLNLEHEALASAHNKVITEHRALMSVYNKVNSEHEA